MKIPCPKTDLKNTILVFTFFVFYILLLTFMYGKFPWYTYLMMICPLLIGMFFEVLLNRSYLLDSSGVTVYRLDRFSQHYRWEEFQTVRVATIKIWVRRWYYPRCLVLSKRRLPYPLTRPDYSWFERHPFSILLFEFTPERYIEFREKFPEIKLEWEDTNGSE